MTIEIGTHIQTPHNTKCPSVPGPGKIELNQGDTVVGSVSRADVAAAAAAAAVASGTVAARTTFEM